MRQERSAGLVLAAVSLIAAGAGVVATVRYPHAVAGSSVLIIVVDVVLLAAYLAHAVWTVRRAGPSSRGVGLWFGVAAGACWSAEIWAGGPARLSHGAERATGATFALAATLISVAAGIVTAARGARPAQVWRGGLVAGAISGALVYAFAVIMTIATLPVLGSRSDYQTQFAASHLPTMADFLINDILGAVTAHLVINLLLGALGSAAGRVVLALRRPPATTTA